MQKTAIIVDKIKEFCHDTLLDTVKVNRKRSAKTIWSFLGVFLLLSIIIWITYYFLYIDGQFVRVDLDYKHRDSFFKKDSNIKITCDCALPILINYQKILKDVDSRQPEFKQCLLRDLANFYDKPILDVAVKLLIYNFLILPINSDIKKHTFNNLIITKDRDIMTKIGNISLLEYSTEVHNNVINYISIFSSDLLASSIKFTNYINLTRHADALDDLLDRMVFDDNKHRLLSNIINCSGTINFDNYYVDDVLDGITVDDCAPTDCYYFAKYNFYQGFVFVVTFYLAIIGYVICIMQCIYQKITPILSDNNIIPMQTISNVTSIANTITEPTKDTTTNTTVNTIKEPTKDTTTNTTVNIITDINQNNNISQHSQITEEKV